MIKQIEYNKAKNSLFERFTNIQNIIKKAKRQKKSFLRLDAKKKTKIQKIFNKLERQLKNNKYKRELKNNKV